MKRCQNCGRSHEDEVIFCDCGFNLRSILPEEAKKAESNRPAKTTSQEIYDSRYPALSTLGSAYALLGWIVIAGCIISGFVSAWSAYRIGGLGAGVILGASPVLVGLIVGLPMLAFRDVIRWMLAIEDHSRRTEELLNKSRRLDNK